MTERVLNELLIGGTRHGQYAPIPEDRNEWFLFPERKIETSPIMLDRIELPEPELYLRADMAGEVDGRPLRRSLFRHSTVSSEQALSAVVELLLTAWVKGEVSPGE
jgi:hypothetical protein